MLPAEFTGQMAIVWWASGVTRIETSRTGNLERLGPFLVGPLRVRQYVDDELEKNAAGIRQEYGAPRPSPLPLPVNPRRDSEAHEARSRKVPGLCLSMETPVDLTRGKIGVGFMRKCPQLAVSFTASQTFAKLAGVDEKRELMGAHTTLSRKIQPRYEKIDAELLTPRQREILRLVSIGHTNREIADVLDLSVRTVEVHRFNLMRRLNVRNVAQLLRRALQLGLLAAPERLSLNPS